VLNQASRLEDDLEVTADRRLLKDDNYEQKIKAHIKDARDAAEEPSSLFKWWTGELIERGWFSLQAAHEDLLIVQLDEVVLTQVPYLVSICQGLPNGYDLSKNIKKSSSEEIDRQVLRQILRQHNVNVDMSHQAVRQFRNRILAISALLMIVLSVAAYFVGPTLREVMGIGALAGAATSVLPLVGAQKPTGPYGIAGAQAVLKIPAGALSALLAAIVLQNGLITPNGPTSGQIFVYAVVFGFSQQALTGLVDKQAGAVAGASRSRVDSSGSTSAKK
jgi:hypothetical protein